MLKNDTELFILKWLILCYMSLTLVKKNICLVVALWKYVWAKKISEGLSGNKLVMSLISCFVVEDVNVMVYFAWSDTSSLGERKLIGYMLRTIICFHEISNSYVEDIILCFGLL